MQWRMKDITIYWWLPTSVLIHINLAIYTHKIWIQIMEPFVTCGRRSRIDSTMWSAMPKSSSFSSISVAWLDQTSCVCVSGLCSSRRWIACENGFSTTSISAAFVHHIKSTLHTCIFDTSTAKVLGWRCVSRHGCVCLHAIPSGIGPNVNESHHQQCKRRCTNHRLV